MAKNWEFFLKEIPITKRLQKKRAYELGVVGWLVGWFLEGEVGRGSSSTGRVQWEKGV